MKILAFGASNSSNSINKKLATFAAGLIKNHETEIIDLNDYASPIFSIDEEKSGIPEPIINLAKKIDASDFLLVSFAENNGSYNAGFKSLFDWLSRIPGRKVFAGKPIIVMATSPGARGGSSVIEAAVNRLPLMGSEVKAVFSLPEFGKNFVDNKIADATLLETLETIISENF